MTHEDDMSDKPKRRPRPLSGTRDATRTPDIGGMLPDDLAKLEWTRTRSPDLVAARQFVATHYGEDTQAYRDLCAWDPAATRAENAHQLAVVLEKMDARKRLRKHLAAALEALDELCDGEGEPVDAAGLGIIAANACRAGGGPMDLLDGDGIDAARQLAAIRAQVEHVAQTICPNHNMRNVVIWALVACGLTYDEVQEVVVVASPEAAKKAKQRAEKKVLFPFRQS